MAKKVGAPFIYNEQTGKWEQVGTTDVHRVQRSEEEPVDPNVEIWIKVITKEDDTTYDVVMLKDGNKKWYAPNDKNLNGIPDRAEVAANSETLGDYPPEYYATAESVTHIVNGTTVVGKATKDSDGNVIKNTYATKEELESIDVSDALEEGLQQVAETYATKAELNTKQPVQPTTFSVHSNGYVAVRTPTRTSHYEFWDTDSGWAPIKSGDLTVTGGGTFSGVTKITNTTASTSTATGALIVSGGIGCAKNIYGNNVYGAVWNDYAEFRNQIEEIKPGYCVASADNGQVYKTTEKFQACDGIVSDTFGFAIGETDECKTPLAVAGRVLAYCEGDRNDYHSGDTVCAGPDGKVCKMTREEIREWPDRIIGIVSEIPQYETWGTGNIEVDNRIWIKIK